MTCLGSMAWWCRKGSFSIYCYNEIMYELPSHNIIYLIPAHAYFRPISTTKSNRAEVDPLAKCDGRRSRQMRDCGGCGPSSNVIREREVVGVHTQRTREANDRWSCWLSWHSPWKARCRRWREVRSPHPLKRNANEGWRWRLSQHTPIERETRTMSRGSGCHSTCLSNARRE